MLKWQEKMLLQKNMLIKFQQLHKYKMIEVMVLPNFINIKLI